MIRLQPLFWKLDLFIFRFFVNIQCASFFSSNHLYIYHTHVYHKFIKHISKNFILKLIKRGNYSLQEVIIPEIQIAFYNSKFLSYGILLWIKHRFDRALNVVARGENGSGKGDNSDLLLIPTFSVVQSPWMQKSKVGWYLPWRLAYWDASDGYNQHSTRLCCRGRGR